VSAATAPPTAGRWKGNALGELRWYPETARLLVDPVWFGKGVPRGSGEHVVLVPGFMTADQSMTLLHSWLKRIGYVPRRSGMRMNVDCSARALDGLERRVAAVAEQTNRPVTLIGHSRGGILGRALAARRPELLERVITLGSGLERGYDIAPAIATALRVVRSYHGLTTDRVAKRGCMTEACTCEFGDDYRAPFPAEVDLVSVWSRQDGISHWRSSRVAYARNVEVSGSHLGLIANRKVYRAIGLALAGQLEVERG
jgi:pimeloyl-ACP methyl ester carboxylesterase